MTKKISYPKMNSEIKAVWLDALRGSSYKQGGGYLENKDITKEVTHCCLGVLVRCQGKRPHPRSNGQELPSIKFLKNCGLSNDIAIKLASMNDGDGDDYEKVQSFKQIANWIERKL